MTQMTQKEFNQIVASHVLWLTGKGGNRANLCQADLRGIIARGTDLTLADLTGANLTGANLTGTDLMGANLTGANLTGANLTLADLTGADLTGAILTGTDLTGTDLTGANLTGANLTGADLTGATLTWAILTGAILTGAELLAYGDMVYLKTMQLAKWAIGYTYDTLQIGCQRHPIAKWNKWGTPTGRRWIAQMAPDALEWADRNLALILQVIERNPAKLPNRP